MRALLELCFRVLALSAVLLWVACSSSNSELRARTALDVLREVVDPAYDFADQACTAREREAVARAKAGDPAGEPDYYAIKQGCVETRAAFRAIRAAHDRVAKYVESGDLTRAEAELERVREQWRALEKEKKPP